MQSRGRGGNRCPRWPQTSSGSRRHRARRRPVLRQYRAAAARRAGDRRWPDRERRPMKQERQRDLALVALVFDLRVEMAEQTDPALIAEANRVALCRASLPSSTSACQREPSRRLISVASIFGSVSRPMRRPLMPGGDHLGVVHHQPDRRVPVSQRQIGNSAVAQHSVRLHDQHAARRSRGPSPLPQRNAGGRKFEVEEIGAHGAILLRTSS